MATKEPMAEVRETLSAGPSIGPPGETVPGEPSGDASVGRDRARRIHDPHRYAVIAEHGRGGLGRVSRAHDRDLGRDVAIKELISRGRLGEARFVREALITARLEHPGIVPIYEAGQWPDGTPFYAMKLVAGRPLRELIAARTTVHERIALLHHVIAVADAIAYAHDRNIIHRDLKPGNVIVGDFGETIVIDWGLAKDLAAPDESLPVPTRRSGSRDEALTRTGHVLGTPAYMAPEQERGERVDQRADVFSIGAMLWELCSLDKVPPDDRTLRRRKLRASRIDDDLAAIIDKALERDPAERYANAGELAADLKAFEAGIRISARRYSLFAMLAHWVRRHRAWSVATATVMVLAAVGTARYVRDIRSERDRAEIARIEAERAQVAVLAAQRATDAALAEQILKRAELLLESDPSAAEEVLASYKGSDRVALQILHARARGLGLARLRATPHTDYIFWLHPLPNGTIASMSADGTVAVTDLDGHSEVIAREVPNKDTLAYSEARSLLAYACRETDLCLVDFARAKPVVVARIQGVHPDGLGFSEDGMQLAAISHDGRAVRWNIEDATHPVQTLRRTVTGWNVGFLDAQTLAVVDSDHVTIIAERAAPRRVEVVGARPNDISWEGRTIVVGTTMGGAMVIDANASVRARMKLCDAMLMSLRFMPDRQTIAFGCQNGAIGLWSPATSTIHAMATVPGSAENVAPDSSGRYLSVAGSAHVCWVVDLSSGITTSYRGHDVHVSVLATPREGFDYFTSGDVNGALRVWPMPPSLVQVVQTAQTRAMDAVFLADERSTISTSGDESIHMQIGRERVELTPHEAGARLLVRSPDLDHVAAYGWGGKLELWSTRARRLLALVDTGQSDTSQLAFLSGTDIVFGGNDGRLLRWTPTGGISTIAKLAGPIESFVVTADHALIASVHDGSLVRVELDGAVHTVTKLVEAARVVELSPDGGWMAAGDSHGSVLMYDTDTWRRLAVAQAAGAIRRMRFSPDGRELAVASRGGMLELTRLPDGGGNSWLASSLIRSRVAISARELAFASDGRLILTGGDGALWVRQADDRWTYIATGTANITVLRPSLDGARIASVDTAGRVMLVDLKASGDACSTPTLVQNETGQQNMCDTAVRSVRPTTKSIETVGASR